MITQKYSVKGSSLRWGIFGASSEFDGFTVELIANLKYARTVAVTYQKPSEQPHTGATSSGAGISRHSIIYLRKEPVMQCKQTGNFWWHEKFKAAGKVYLFDSFKEKKK